MLPSMGIVGENGSGKTTFVNYVKEKRPHYIVLTAGHLWDEYAREHGMIKENESLTHIQRTELGVRIFAEYGDDFIAKRFREKINPANEYLVDGVRQQHVMDALKECLGAELVFVGIKSDPETRLRRLMSREGYTEEQFRKREEIDSRYDTKKLMTQCSKLIENNSDDASVFFRNIDELLRSLEWEKR